MKKKAVSIITNISIVLYILALALYSVSKIYLHYSYEINKLGIIFVIIIPVSLIFIYILIKLIDKSIDNRKHRKKIVRRRNRRRERYRKEGIFNGGRAV